MIIGPSLVIVIFCNLIVSSLITSVATNIDKTYHHDKKAYDFSIIASSVGFGGIGILIGLLLVHKMYYNINRVYLYSLLWMWTVLLALAGLTYYVYDRLIKSRYYPVGAEHTANKTELYLSFAAFCLSIVGISIGLTYVITTGIHEGYFDSLSGNVFGIKDFFEGLFNESSSSSKTRKAVEQIEMDDLISDLTESSF